MKRFLSLVFALLLSLSVTASESFIPAKGIKIPLGDGVQVTLTHDKCTNEAVLLFAKMIAEQDQFPFDPAKMFAGSVSIPSVGMTLGLCYQVVDANERKVAVLDELGSGGYLTVPKP